jgi:hypothetical protein
MAVRVLSRQRAEEVPVNLNRVKLLLSKLPIKDRDAGVSVPFNFNPNQERLHNMVQQHYAKHGSIRVILLKARRVGGSSYFDALAAAHCLARPQAHAMIVAHLKDVADKGLFRVPRDLMVALNDKFQGCVDVRTKSIIFPHSLGDSNLDLATAGSVGTGRGLTLSYLHLSEAASYPGQQSFVSILPAVSKAPDTVIVLESTAQGRTGIGETFYEYWNAAHATGAKWNGFTPIFLSWLDDPACHRAATEAEDAPVSDFEKELMKEYNASRSQIAWMRMTLEGECKGSELLFNQEYPHTPEVAFVATGDPAFTQTEIKYALSTKKPPLAKGNFVRSGMKIEFQKNVRGKVMLWEYPQARCYYYIGVDCARGIEAETGRASGDFAAYVVLNGTTGNVAARFSDWVNPVEMADDVSKAGMYFNKAMMNIELTGNLGLWTQQVLRDTYMYPNWYVWKGKDDKQPGKSKSHALGFETQTRSRDLLFSTFRGKLHDGMNNMPGGLSLHDEEIIRQMDLMTMATGMRWEVEHGHDDVIMAFMLAVIACSQYPPPNIANWKANYLEKNQKSTALESLSPQQHLQNALRSDLAMIMRPDRKRCRTVLGPV